MLRMIRDYGLLPPVKLLNRGLRAASAVGHRIQMMLEWGIRPHPEWFDHFIDQHCQWRRTRTPLSWERGIFNLLAIKPGANVLELCCGDGFNAYHFYSIRARNVLAVDYMAAAIAHAKRYLRAPNITYAIVDIRNGLPTGTFDNVIWDAAIGHLSEADVESVLRQIKARLGTVGILSGYTNRAAEQKAHTAHQYEFKSPADLERVLRPHFKNVLVWQTEYPKRSNLYFFASQGALPFDAEWKAGHI